MPFALTAFIFPLKEPVELSKHLGYALDNPRTEDEIKMVEELVRSACEKYPNSEFEVGIGFQTSLAISDFTKALKAEDKEPYMVNYFETQREVPTMSLLSKSWVIARFMDDGDFEKHLKNKDSFFEIVIQRESNSYTKAFSQLQNYLYILSLLANDEDSHYHGESILIAENFLSLFHPSDTAYYQIKKALQHFNGYAGLSDSQFRAHSWKFWVDGIGELLGVASRVEETISKQSVARKKPISQQQTPYEKIMFIGSLLRTIDRDVHDIKIKLILLVSVIEYLLTRNPQTDRFNVEDSISKQFKLKAAILIHNEGSNKNLELIKADLEKIYKQRSDIAHGNYHGDHEEDDYLQSVLKLYGYIRAIMKMYFVDRTFVEYLKDN